MAVTLKDVAKLAGVSTSTVSRVLNKDPRISAKTRSKVLKCTKSLDYKVNSIARSLKTNKSYTIGFITPELPNDFFMNVAEGVEKELLDRGYTTIICSSNESRNGEQDRIELLMEKCVDGMIIIPATGEGNHYSRISEFGIPVVLVDRLVENFTTDAVLVDNFNGSYSAVEHLITNGCRRIGFIGGNVELTSAKERYEGYKKAFEDYGISLEKEIIKTGDFHVDSGYRLMGELLKNPTPPQYVFISNYFMHVGATKYLIDNGGADHFHISIASFDDMQLSSILGFCTITVAQPMLDIGRKAAEILVDRIDGNTTGPASVHRLQTTLKTR